MHSHCALHVANAEMVGEVQDFVAVVADEGLVGIGQGGVVVKCAGHGATGNPRLQ